jgi:hypothetical protein
MGSSKIKGLGGLLNPLVVRVGAAAPADFAQFMVAMEALWGNVDQFVNNERLDS